MKNVLRKIVYFDEQSAIDYLQILDKGKKVKKVEATTSLEGKAKGNTEAGVKKEKQSLLGRIFGSDITGELSGGLGGDVNGKRISRTITENSLLYSFIKQAINTQKIQRIEKFTNYKITIPKDSMTYYVSIAPITTMMSGESMIDSNISMEVNKMYDAIKNLKGYFEVVGTSGTKKQKIFRFNINCFRNNYRIQDLTRMSLDIFAIKVGKSTISDLNFNAEFNVDEDIDENDFVGFTENNKEKKDNTVSDKELDVYDVYLAGVE